MIAGKENKPQASPQLGGTGAVTSIIAGTGISISPGTGLGNVTITNTGSGIPSLLHGDIFQGNGSNVATAVNLISDTSDVPSIEYSNRFLTDTSSFTAVDWGGRQLRDTNGSTINLSWGGGLVTIPYLGGGGTQMVTADNSGVLGTAAIPSITPPGANYFWYSNPSNVLTGDTNATRIIGTLTKISDSFGAGDTSALQVSNNLLGLGIAGAAITQSTASGQGAVIAGNITGLSDYSVSIISNAVGGTSASATFNGAASTGGTKLKYQGAGTLVSQMTLTSSSSAIQHTSATGLISGLFATGSNLTLENGSVSWSWALSHGVAGSILTDVLGNGTLSFQPIPTGIIPVTPIAYNTSTTAPVGPLDYEVTTGTGATTIILPTGTNDPIGTIVIVKDLDAISASGSPITVDAGIGNTINAGLIAQTFIINTNGMSLTIKKVTATAWAVQ